MDVIVDQLNVEIAGKRLLRNLSLDIAKSETVGLVGPNGSGKTTALRCLYRALRPTNGTIRVGDQELHAMSLRTSAQYVAALAQDGDVALDFTAAEMVALGRTPHLRGNERLSPAERDLCLRAMEQLHVAHLADRGVLTLSGGERQRVLIARSLVQQPRVLVLDEPTNHLDIHNQIELLSQLRGSGITVLLVLHDLNLAAAACDRIGVLSGGSLVEFGTPSEVLRPELIREAFGVDASVVTHPLTGAPQVLYTVPSTVSEDRRAV